MIILKQEPTGDTKMKVGFSYSTQFISIELVIGTPRGVARGCLGAPFREKMPRGGHRAKQLFAESKIFSAGGHSP